MNRQTIHPRSGVSADAWGDTLEECDESAPHLLDTGRGFGRLIRSRRG